MLVSVVVPLYNLGHVVHEAVSSLIKQTYQDLEIIIVNDGSTDNSGRVADVLAERDPRIRVIHQENRGLPGALNRGFGEAKGDCFLILSSDDMLLPNAVGAMVEKMDQVGVDVVNTDMLVNKQHVKTRYMDLETLKRANCHGYAALFKRWVFEKTGGFKEMHPSWEDYEFWVHAAKLGARGARVPMPHFVYRPNPVGRDAKAQGLDRVLRGKMEGYHPDVFGKGRGLVTFVIPLYDHEKWVREAAESALGQTYPHIQVIVVDDGSPGDPMAALAGLPINLIRQDNRGLSAARNAGLGAALQTFGSQYAVCLDSDDAVDEGFVEETMAAMEDRQYVYSDLTFIGDAYHEYQVSDFDCTELYQRHLHACTFLFPLRMWQEIVASRGYGYDEAMRSGFEDWEFAMACAELGWCGKRLKAPLFRYRWHANGSMRTEANKIKADLGRYIRSKHNRSTLMAGCTSCGGGRRARRASNSANAQAGGQAMTLGAPIQVTYTGLKNGKMTKIGRAGKIYRYNRQNPTFFADAHDAHLFEGPFIVRAAVAAAPAQPPQMQQPQGVAAPVAQPRPAPIPSSMPQMPAPAAPPGPPSPPPPPVPQPQSPVMMAEGRPPQRALEEKDITEAIEKVSRMLKDDLTQIKGIGPSLAKKLVGAGLTTFLAVANANVVELAQVLGRNVNFAQEIQDVALELAD